MMLDDSITLSRNKFTRLISAFAGLAGYPNPEDPLPPGPWDPVIKDSILNFNQPFQADRHPRRWQRQQEQIASSINWAMLNPQPLPPREEWAKVAAQAIVDDIQHKTQLIQLLPEKFQHRAAEGIQGNLAQLVDEVCGTGWPRRWPFPIPPFPWPPEPEPDPREMFINPLDLIIMGVVFDNLAGTVMEGLQGALRETAVAFQNAGLERMG